MKTVELFDVMNDGKGLDYFIPEKDHVPMNSLPALFQEGYIAFVIGAMHFTKRLPPEKIIEICSGIHYPIVLLGGPAEKETGHAIMKAAGSHVLNACGEYNMNQSVSLLDQSRLVISHDTGLMHIAAARKKDVFSIWGTTTHEFGVEPYMAGKNSMTFEVKGLKCRPCSRYGRAKCPKKHFKCMWDIPGQDIVDQANSLVR
jgi:heptosyltransferase-2